jgi:MerR family transcriptional regulator, light-induced transcriptional regulator
MTTEELKHYTIQMAAHAAGLSPHTIRAWEKRYGALTPERTETGRRLYSAIEVERLTLLSQLTNLGSAIGQIARLTDEQLKEIYQRLMKTKTSATMPAAKPSLSNVGDLKAKILNSVTSYDVSLLSRLLSETKSSLSPRDFALEIVQPVMREVENGLQSQKFQKAQFRALQALVRAHAGSVIYSHYVGEVRAASKFILTSVDNDYSAFEPLVTALLCCEHRKNFFYLNPNLPSMSLIDSVKAISGDILILNMSRIPVNEAKNYLLEVIHGISPKVRIWVYAEDEIAQINVSFAKNVQLVSNYIDLDQLIGENV